MRSASFLSFFAICVTTAQAQMAVPMPVEMKALDFLTGEWTGIMKMTLPGSDRVMDVKTSYSCKPFGAYQETIYTMEMPGMPKYTGHSFTKWNRTTKQFQSWTFDDSADEPREETGTFDGSKFIMTSKPHGGMVTRATFSKAEKGQVNFLIEMKIEDKFVKLGECLFAKKGS